MNASDVTDSLTARGALAPAPAAPSGWAWAALPVAAAGLAGSLCLSLGLNLKPLWHILPTVLPASACPLCFYQRAFVMSLVGVLGMGLLAGAARPRRLGLLALPLAVAGLGVALFHVSLELRGKLECPQGLLGLGTAPKQSLAVFVILTALLGVDALSGARKWGALAGAVALGALLAVGSTVANPKMQRPDPAVYDHPPDVCRPPLLP
jgi:disulfide bond formation protein DsbB